MDTGVNLVKREEEISLATGRIIGELYDAFLKLYGDNPTEDDLRNLNVLCVRIVFCLCAEDAGILPKNAFYNYLNRFISRDIPMALQTFFDTLNTPIAERGRFLDPDLARLPYVNGGLFGNYSPADFADCADSRDAINRVSTHPAPPNTLPEKSASSARSYPPTERSEEVAKRCPSRGAGYIPPFSTAMRQLLLEKASLNFDWSAISLTIFGAVFESTLNPDTRRKGGMHYTSVENIHKVIDPLFLEELWREFREIVGLEESKSRQVEEGDEPRNRGGEEGGESRSKPLCDVPRIGMGNQPIDDGNYLFTDEEKAAFLAKEPAAAPYFRKWYGSVEFINRKPRWCLWLGDCTPAQLRAMPHCYARVAAVREFRLKCTRASTLKLADRPPRFQTENMPNSDYLLIPSVSFERRRYVPIGFMDKADLASNLVLIIPNATLYHFGVLTSSVHMAWMRAVCGRLKSDYRYSKDVVYNNFP